MELTDTTRKDGSPGAVLMLQGTASDVGKSVVTAALCRIFVQDGYRTAPFKSQNMALNSYVTADGKEIGRAQGMQAEACGIEATTDMNPILIKPTGDMHSQIVVHGRPLAHMSATDYRSRFLPEAKDTVLEALDRLRGQYDIVVMEGAGSPAEINLKDRDIVNMNLAGWADAPVLLVADIDRGGVFAFLVGTLELLEPHERQRVKGFIINKFRGDLSLLQPGLDWLEERTGIPVLGVLPYIPDIRIEAEDSVVLDELTAKGQSSPEADIDIAVIRYPRISNFTDFDPLQEERDVRVRFVTKAADLGHPDVIILPGTKDTIGDLQYLRSQGFDLAIAAAVESGDAQLAGICGGYQMLGKMLHDPDAADGGVAREEEGLGYLPVATTFAKEKRTVRVTGRVADHSPLLLSAESRCLLSAGEPIFIEGYEIHMGQSRSLKGEQMAPVFKLGPDGEQPAAEGWGTLDGRIWGTYLHGVFHNDRLRRLWLDRIRESKGLRPVKETFSASGLKEQEFDRVASLVRAHLDLEQVYQIMGISAKTV
ncbi:cobyric acid synthase [Paenibacillus sp. Y412MC10]|uniref:cobyric acid synthase n=1 Tax=Geobacillus sp. (strain Y412MC10) TaxID=481743 RepID=UPI0021B268D3|nr:cobyric acid synthase [Paenibacillus sp. Y412MC10]